MFFFFQAEDGIRDIGVTGVQTCALPISRRPNDRSLNPIPSRTLGEGDQPGRANAAPTTTPRVDGGEIGRASCRGKSVDLGGRRIIKKKKSKKTKHIVHNT